MIWVGIVVLAALTLAPFALCLRRSPAQRGKREVALALHRSQLDELDRDRAQDLISEAEHANARIELQRRLLAAAGATDAAASTGSRWPLVATLALVPLAGVGLYLTSGRPMLPGAPLAPRLAAIHAAEARNSAMIASLRSAIAALPANDPRRREGDTLLGQAEAELGHMAEAGVSWRAALALGFSPDLALKAAEAETEADGHVTPRAADLFRQALAAAPDDASWREMAEARLAEYEHEQ